MHRHNYLLVFLVLLASIPWSAVAQRSTTVSGTIKDATGNTLPGVSILIKGTTTGTTSDGEGKYNIVVENPDAILTFSFIGYKNQELLVGSQTTIDIILDEDISTLEEVVVVGYGEMKKSDLTGAVAQVKASNLSQSPAASVDNLLKGRAAGLQVISNSGQPGAGATIRIRGSNSFDIGASNPLLVVDGIPVGDAGNLKQINPLDIETIDVLKDASAAAIYGSRGSNGVIIVTTKKGKANQSSIEANYQVGVASLPKAFDIITDPYLFAQLSNEGAANVSQPQRYIGQVNPENGVYYPSLSEISSGAWGKKVNWTDQVFQRGVTQNINVAARGGTDATQYGLSLGYFDQEGLVIGNDYRKYTTNVSIDQRIRKNIKGGFIVNLAFIDEDKPSSAGWMAGGLARNPIFPIYDDNGQFFKLAINDFGNPVAVRKLVHDQSKTFDLFGTAYIDWEIVKDLSFRTNLRTTYGEAISDYYEPIGFGGGGNQYHGQGSINNYKGLKWVFDNYLTYNKTINSVHRMSVMLGTSYENAYNRTSNLTGRNFVNDFLRNENLGSATERVISNGYSKTLLMSYFGRANYSYNDRYLLTATVRADGSSKFGDDNKYGYFPTMAAAWNVHNESFWASNVVSTLKARVGWGVTGNQSALSPYRTLDRFSNTLYWMDGAWATGYGPGFVSSVDQQGRSLYEGIANSGLKWETTRQMNAGIDVNFLQNRIRVTADYYDKYTYDLLRLARIAISSGYHLQWQNDGDVSNKGVELSINADVIDGEEFGWTVGFNISHNKSEVRKVDQDVVMYQGEEFVRPRTFGATQEYFRAVPNNLAIGQPMFVFFGYQTDGIIQTVEEGLDAGLTGAEAQPGEIKYVDRNGDGVVDEFDRTFIGDPNPKMFFGFNSNLRYKGFELGVFLTGTVGNDVVNMQRLNQGSSQYQRWTLDNPTNDFPRLNGIRLNRFSDFFIEDGSHVRIQNVSLSYNVSLPEKLRVKSLRLNANCENLWTFSKFSGYDPEASLNTSGYGVYGGIGYPRPRVFTIGANLTF
ncbi:SusC/RagA family TonB-linked outer membrane protein [Pseudochryseolinea flava]|uniref:SusC/RagA family protein n=1 Tax=Pseudochryseolinea flava TaxID=2059302 RepID=A0A364XYP0_9BACT|nr:TonB-dependent receptor [Pseudochryseolinea flava]RAV99457.1 SusC/RagA family protein [Pseudochryseolinea flava]